MENSYDELQQKIQRLNEQLADLENNENDLEYKIKILEILIQHAKSILTNCLGE